MCLAEGLQRSDASEAQTRGPQSQVKLSTIEPRCSQHAEFRKGLG